MPTSLELRAAAVTFVSILLTFFAALGLRAAFSFDVSIVILGVALAVMLARTGAQRGLREQLLGVILLPIVGLGAFGVGDLLVSQPVLGSALFVFVVSAAIWVRRFGSRATRWGTTVALPFVAVLITPLPVLPPSGAAFTPGVALIAVVAALIAMLVNQLAAVTGLVPHRPAPAASPKKAAAQPRRPTPRRLLPSTRMAIQLAVALSLAFLIGHLWLNEHWPWVVITAYVVTSGNRGRGDVAYKGVMRVIGAVLGTGVATLLAGLFAAGDPAAIVWIFVALAVGTLLRSVNYAFWAASITAALALLYGYFGEGGVDLLAVRIVGVVIGGALAVASAWFILPIRTGDVLRRRMFDSLAALSEVLQTARTEPEQLGSARARFDSSVLAIEQLVPTLRAADLILRLRRVEHSHGQVAVSLRRCKKPVAALAEADPDSLRETAAVTEIVVVARRVGALRRALADHAELRLPQPLPADPPAGVPTDVARALREIDAAISAWS